MTVEKIDIDNCFNTKSTPRLWERFHPTDGPVYDPTRFEQMTYRCSDCAFQVTFEDKDFQKHRHSNFTNLTDTESLLLDRFVAENKLKQNSFLDFYCPDCKKPTRIYFSDGYGGKQGDYIVDIDFCLAIRNAI